MTDENICYAVGCRNPGPMRCQACRCVHYCSRKCQQKDWKDGGHKENCRKYQMIAKVRAQNEPRGPEGLIATIELREGRIPLCWALEHEATARVVTQGILDTGYRIIHRRTGRRLTHEINETELSHVERREIVMGFFLDWLADLAINNNAQLERTLAKNAPECHVCGTSCDVDAPLREGGLMPDQRWVFTKNLCRNCFRSTSPQSFPDKSQFEWQIVAYEGMQNIPPSWLP